MAIDDQSIVPERFFGFCADIVRQSGRGHASPEKPLRCGEDIRPVPKAAAKKGCEHFCSTFHQEGLDTPPVECVEHLRDGIGREVEWNGLHRGREWTLHLRKDERGEASVEQVVLQRDDAPAIRHHPQGMARDGCQTGVETGVVQAGGAGPYQDGLLDAAYAVDVLLRKGAGNALGGLPGESRSASRYPSALWAHLRTT